MYGTKKTQCNAKFGRKVIKFTFHNDDVKIRKCNIIAKPLEKIFVLFTLSLTELSLI